MHVLAIEGSGLLGVIGVGAVVGLVVFVIASQADEKAVVRASLRQLASFAGGLRGIYASTANDAATARRIADHKQQVLGQAERRRAVVEERAERQARVVAKAGESPALGARKKFGTGLE